MTMTTATIIETPVKLSLTRSFDAPPEKLFDAWLDGSWRDWLGSHGVVCLDSQLDARVGGHYRMDVRMPDGSEKSVGGTYRAIERPFRLVFTWNGCFTGGETLVTLTFRPRGAGTELTLTHEGFTGADMRDRHNEGWSNSFDRLTARLAR
jgi:uncharacterized protein YndB with AHSA1/START domain